MNAQMDLVDQAVLIAICFFFIAVVAMLIFCFFFLLQLRHEIKRLRRWPATLRDCKGATDSRKDIKSQC
jgi:hypothetical protein